VSGPPPYVGGYVGGYVGYEAGAHRVGQRIKAESGEGVPLSLFLAQDVIVGLMLPFATTAERRLEVRAEELHGVELVRLAPDSHPDEMQMIGHEAVGGAEKVFARGGVVHEFAERGVKSGRQPAAGAFLQRVSPENDGVALVTMFFESRKIPFGSRGHALVIQVAQGGVKSGCSHRGNEVDFSFRTVGGIRLITSAATTSVATVQLPIHLLTSVATTRSRRGNEAEGRIGGIRLITSAATVNGV
jgi:hypothetical protein